MPHAELMFEEVFKYILKDLFGLWPLALNERMYSTLVISITIIFIVHNSDSATIKAASECTDYPCLIFDEDFDTFDLRTWKHQVTSAATGNHEFQYYTNNRSNSYVKEGVLHLTTTLTNNTYDEEFLRSGTLDLWAGDRCHANRGSTGCYRTGTRDVIINPIQSASITTQDSFSFTYGKMEVMAQMPVGDWLWPAAWLMPKDDAYGMWPASGEIDLLESRGNANLHNNDDGKTHVGNKRVLQSLHWGPYFPINGQPYTLAKTNKKHGTFSDRFHKFAFEWTPESIEFYIDGKCTLNVTMKDHKGFWHFGQLPDYLDNPWVSGTKLAPFDKDFYIILNLAVGGTNEYFHSTYTPKAPWSNDAGKKAKTQFWKAKDQWLPSWTSPTYKIDHVKVWKMQKDG